MALSREFMVTKQILLLYPSEPSLIVLSPMGSLWLIKSYERLSKQSTYLFRNAESPSLTAPLPYTTVTVHVDVNTQKG